MSKFDLEHMLLTRFLLFSLASLLAIGVAQSQGKVDFVESTFDFGTIKEVDGNVSHQYTFFNMGKDSVRLDAVQASCGCTTSGYTQDWVAPGKSGWILATFDPRGRPGPFLKSVSVTPSSGEPIVLTFSGVVIPRPIDISDEYPYVQGELRFPSQFVNFYRVRSDQRPHNRVRYYNSSDRVVTFNPKYESPEYLSVAFEPPAIQPHKYGYIKVRLDPSKVEHMGYNNDSIIMYTDAGDASARISLSAVGNIDLYYPPMSDTDYAKQPHIMVSHEVFDFKKIKDGDEVTEKIEIKNLGEETLEIIDIGSNCGCLVTDLRKTEIKPGKSAKMKVTFNAEGRSGYQANNISIYSNDPRQPMTTVKVLAQVGDKE